MRNFFCARERFLPMFYVISVLHCNLFIFCARARENKCNETAAESKRTSQVFTKNCDLQVVLSISGKIVHTESFACRHKICTHTFFETIVIYPRRKHDEINLFFVLFFRTTNIVKSREEQTITISGV